MKKEEIGIISYILGVISIVLAFFQPLAGFIFGVIGLIKVRKQKTELSKKARLLNIIGSVLSLIVFILLVFLSYYLTQNNLLQNFPIA